MNQNKIDFWIKNNQNVLFSGKHGVGKTAIVKDAFERHGLNYRYFSASTMDPWVDFIGVPKEKSPGSNSDQMLLIKDLLVIDRNLAIDWILSNWGLSKDRAEAIISSLNSTPSYLELIRPLVFANGDIEALFFDEFNRSPKKVRNAVMELLQFKSINGHVFPKLRLIWAAINPEDDSSNIYDVEKIDPAQKDRFHVFVPVPYKPNVEWFREIYGKKISDAAVQWWEELEDKDEVSPRRLQYALDTYLKKGDMRDVLPLSSNVSKLLNALSSGPIMDRLESFLSNDQKDEARNFLLNENNFSSAIKYIVKSNNLMSYFLPLVPKEKISVLLSQNDSTSSFIVNNSIKIPIFKEVCEEVVRANTNSSLVKKIRKYFTESQFVLELSSKSICKSFYNKDADCFKWHTLLKSLSLKDLKKDRLTVMKDIASNIPQIITRVDVKLCLGILSKLDPNPTEIAEGVTMSTPWSNFIGIVNHLIYEGAHDRKEIDIYPKPMSLKSFKEENIEQLSNIYAQIKLAGFEDMVVKSQEQLKDLVLP
jgi:MoxR-like ATPase